MGTAYGHHGEQQGTGSGSCLLAYRCVDLEMTLHFGSMSGALVGIIWGVSQETEDPSFTSSISLSFEI